MGYKAFARWPIFKIVTVFVTVAVFFKRFFAKKDSNVLVERFLACFWHFKFLTQKGYFKKSIAFSSRPILAIFKMLPFFEY